MDSLSTSSSLTGPSEAIHIQTTKDPSNALSYIRWTLGIDTEPEALWANTQVGICSITFFIFNVFLPPGSGILDGSTSTRWRFLDLLGKL